MVLFFGKASGLYVTGLLFAAFVFVWLGDARECGGDWHFFWGRFGRAVQRLVGQGFAHIGVGDHLGVGGRRILFERSGSHLFSLDK